MRKLLVFLFILTFICNHAISSNLINNKTWDFNSQSSWGQIPKDWTDDSQCDKNCTSPGFRTTVFNGMNVLEIRTQGGTCDRIKLRTSETFRTGSFEWKVYIPKINEIDASAAITAFLYAPRTLIGFSCDREIDWEIGYGKSLERLLHGIKEGQLMCYMTIQNDPTTSTLKDQQVIPVDESTWYYFKITLTTDKNNNYSVNWYIRKEKEQYRLARSTGYCKYGPGNTSFSIECSVENFCNNWIGDENPVLEKYAYYDFVSFTEFINKTLSDNIFYSIYWDWSWIMFTEATKVENLKKSYKEFEKLSIEKLDFVCKKYGYKSEDFYLKLEELQKYWLNEWTQFWKKN